MTEQLHEVDLGFDCCRKHYYYGGHSLKCKLQNAFDADFSRDNNDIRELSVETYLT